MKMDRRLSGSCLLVRFRCFLTFIEQTFLECLCFSRGSDGVSITPQGIGYVERVDMHIHDAYLYA